MTRPGAVAAAADRAAGSHRRVAVVGAGLAGLSAAHALRRQAAGAGEALELDVWEAGDRPGGQLHTVVEDGFVVEWAANAFRSGVGAARDLVATLGLEPERVEVAAGASRRYVFHGGALHALPSGPASLLSFAPMSLAGRLRVLAEPLTARRVDHEESVHDYATRHIGREAAEVLLGTMVRGVYGGDARQLSVDAAFPVMREMEREHRSLVIAGIAGAQARKREGKTTWSLTRGMGSLMTRLADDLGDTVRLGVAVQALGRDAASGRFGLRLPGDETRAYDAVVLAVPPRVAARLLATLDSAAAGELAAIPTAPIGMVALAFDRAAFRTPPDGYGFLVAPGEDLAALGTLIESNVFPGRAPAGTVLVRVIMGGVDDPGFDARSDADLAASALETLDRAWGLTGEPLRHWVGRQDEGIPQYVLGHGARLTRIAERLRAHPGLHLAGNAYRGVAVGRLVEDADVVATEVLRGLESAAVARS
jgi:protoporphyrinogen/coproporphyrinogen III oxidase